MRLERLYERSPVVVQNAFATAYGFRERRLRYSGRYREYYAALKSSEWWPRERLEEHQQVALTELLRFCDARIPYYRRVFKDAGLDVTRATVADLASLPYVEKRDLREDPTRFIPVPEPRGLITQTTGGTTGTPLRYKVTREAVQYNYAAYEARIRNWAGVRFGQRMASISGKVIVPNDTVRPPFWRSNLAFNQLYLSAYHLSERNLPFYIQRLERFRPAVIVGYTSTVHAIARFILEHDQIGRVRPTAVLVTSETLLAPVRADIERAFGCKLFDNYGLGELAAFISECPAGSMHISPEFAVVEVVGTGGDGGEIIGTGLRNLGMPLVRYRTGDLCVPAFDRTCDCGRELPIVERIVGRVDDVLVTADGGTLGAAALSLAFQSIPHLREGQVHQRPGGALVAHVAVTPEFDEHDERRLLDELRKRVGPLAIEVKRVEALQRTGGGKQRVIIRDV